MVQFHSINSLWLEISSHLLIYELFCQTKSIHRFWSFWPATSSGMAGTGPFCLFMIEWGWSNNNLQSMPVNHMIGRFFCKSGHKVVILTSHVLGSGRYMALSLIHDLNKVYQTKSHKKIGLSHDLSVFPWKRSFSGHIDQPRSQYVPTPNFCAVP